MSLSASRPIRALLLGAVIALMAGLLGPVGSAVAAGPPVTLTASITGTPTVGETLTAVAGSLSPDNADLTYQWQTTSPATDIAGATSSTFVPTTDQIGQQVQVVINGNASDRDPGSATSAATSAVQGVFSSAPVVALDTRSAFVDEWISAWIFNWSLPFADTYTWQWYADGTAITGATGPDYKPTPDVVGKVLVAKATPVKTNYVSSSGVASSEATWPVLKADFIQPPKTFISGVTKVGEELTATALASYPAADDYTYRWAADGYYIAGATSDTFTLTADQYGKTLTAIVTATKAGYNDTYFETYPTDVVGAGTFTKPATVNLSTTGPKVGDALKATPAGMSPAADSYVYQWYKISLLGVKTPIVGAVGQTYNVPFGALQYKLQAKVTAIKSGYTSRSSSSVQTARVNQIILDKTSVTRGQSLKITGKRLQAGQVYRMFIDGKTVYKGKASSTGTAVRTVTVPTSIGAGTKRVWISGYTSSGVRNFQVLTTVVIK